MLSEPPKGRRAPGSLRCWGAGNDAWCSVLGQEAVPVCTTRGGWFSWHLGWYGCDLNLVCRSECWCLGKETRAAEVQGPG
jgi:hypothetical protein